MQSSLSSMKTTAAMTTSQHLVLLLFIGATWVEGGRYKQHNDTEHRLHEYLFTTYNKHVKPILDHSQPVQVNVQVYWGQLINLSWRNELLTWDYDEFDGIHTIDVPVDKIWIPQFIFHDSSDPRKPSFITDDKMGIMLSSNGMCNWLQYSIIESGCDIDVSNFPFDNQTCKLRFGTIPRPEKLNFTSKYTQHHSLDFFENSLWYMDSFGCQWERDGFEQVLHCHLHISRKSLYYMFNIILPISLILIVGGLCFCLPIESGEKVGLSVTVLLAMTVFLILVMEILPVNSNNIPYLEKFIAAAMVLLAMSCVMDVTVIAFHYQPSSPFGLRLPPKWMVWFGLGPLARVLLIDGRVAKRRYDKLKVQHKQKSLSLLPRGRIEKTDTDNGIGNNNGNGNPDGEDGDEMEKVVTQTWFCLAFIVDRLFFLLYAVMCVVVLVVVLVKASKYHPDEVAAHDKYEH